MQYQAEADALKKSHWPACDALADALARRGAAALDALEYALKSRTHHVRSASLRAIAKIDTDRARAVAKTLLADRAYEVRETAAQVLGVPTPP